MVTTQQLTARQHQVMVAIQQFRATRGYSPTVRELGELLHVSSPCTIQRHLEALQRKGVIERVPGKARCVALARDRHEGDLP